MCPYKLIIPVPDMERFNPKPAVGGRTTYTWGLVHGTTVSAAAAILTKGLFRPADWQRNADPSKSQLPTFGLFSIGQQVNRNDTEIPEWAEKVLLDRALKRGKGQQPILIGGIYKGSEQHVSLKAGGNDEAQLIVAQTTVGHDGWEICPLPCGPRQHPVRCGDMNRSTVGS